MERSRIQILCVPDKDSVYSVRLTRATVAWWLALRIRAAMRRDARRSIFATVVRIIAVIVGLFAIKGAIRRNERRSTHSR